MFRSLLISIYETILCPQDLSGLDLLLYLLWLLPLSASSSFSFLYLCFYHIHKLWQSIHLFQPNRQVICDTPLLPDNKLQIIMPLKCPCSKDEECKHLVKYQGTSMDIAGISVSNIFSLGNISINLRSYNLLIRLSNLSILTISKNMKL
jgi:hypothetical protein